MERLKVFCKDYITKDGYKINITKGNSYDVIESYAYTPSDPTNKENFVVYSIINDKNIRASYKQSWFKSVSDIREEKLNELGIK